MREFIRSNPKTTFREISQKLKTKIDRVYIGGLEEAFKDAGIIPPRNFRRMTVDEKKKIIADFIKDNPNAGGHIIKKETKINVCI